MKLAILMDAPELLNPRKDSTIAMIQAAHELGWKCVYFTQKDLWCLSDQAYANVSTISLDLKSKRNWWRNSACGAIALSEFDIILIRKDPPFNMEYIYATYALELAEKAGVLVANKPQSLRDANEKFHILSFPQCCPPSLVSANIDKLREFWHKHQQVIFKPLNGMGGDGIFYVGADGCNLSVILETLTRRENTSIMAQQYVPAIKTVGDKRILLINGEPVAYGLLRIPLAGELRGNLAAGASSQVVALTDRDRWICTEISASLKARGLYFVGIDVIGEYLTEINITSPTCIVEITSATGINIACEYLTMLARLKSNFMMEICI